MKRTLIAVVVLAALPLVALAQYAEVTPWFDGTPNSYFGGWGANAENFVKLVPSRTQFNLDSIRVRMYRPNTTFYPTVNIRVNIYSPTGTALGNCGCTTGPDTLRGTYGLFACAWGTATGIKIFTFNINPNLDLTGPFIVGIEYVSRSGTGTYWPSLLWDNSATYIECCNQYWDYQLAPGVRDNEAMFTTVPGPQYTSALGTLSGDAVPGHLVIGNLTGMGGAVLDSTVDDTLTMFNSGGTALTVSSITSNNSMFTTGAVGGGILVNPGSRVKLAAHFTPTVAGDTMTTLSFTDNVPATVITNKDLTGRGYSHTNLILFENWWNDNGYGGWPIYRLGAADTVGFWGLYYTGGHTGDFTNVWARHTYTAATADTIFDILASPWLTAPAGGTVRLNYRELVSWPADYAGHFLCLADSDTTWYVIGELLPGNADWEWDDYPVTFYVTGLDSEFTLFELGFAYFGINADMWDLDDIAFHDVPQEPPFMASDPRGDAFDSNQQLVADAFDPNTDPFTVTAHIQRGTGAFLGYPMTETPAGSGHFCLDFTAFLSDSGVYTYYLTANDAQGETRWPEAGDYTFEVQSEVGATEIIYHDGTWNNAHYYYDMSDEDAVRFTPPGYPFMLTGARISILHNWPDGAHEQIVVKVYDDDGTDGLPGALLYEQQTGSIGNVCAGMNDSMYVPYDASVVFRTNLTFNSGTFYISVHNPAAATTPYVEGWTIDTLGSGNSYGYDASAGTWSAWADSLGDLMFSALGYVVPNPPVLTVYGNPGNTSASIYVNSTVGAIPPVNIYVSSPFSAPPALMAGSPFTTSPITYIYPGPGTGSAFFAAKTVYGAGDMLRQAPPDDPDHPTCSVVTRPGHDVSVAPSLAAKNFDAADHVPARVDFRTPTLVTIDPLTGAKTFTPLGRRLGKGTPLGVTSPEMRGPVRPVTKGASGFDTLINQQLAD